MLAQQAEWRRLLGEISHIESPGEGVRAPYRTRVHTGAGVPNSARQARRPRTNLFKKIVFIRPP